MDLKNFTLSEFDSPDQEGSGQRMDTAFLEMLDRARSLAGVPFVITSGYRTKSHNKAVGGVPSSSHISGNAADISISTSHQRFLVVAALLKVGFTRIGIAENFIHVDNDHRKPSHVIWTY